MDVVLEEKKKCLALAENRTPLPQLSNPSLLIIVTVIPAQQQQSEAITKNVPSVKFDRMATHAQTQDPKPTGTLYSVVTSYLRTSITLATQDV